MIILENNELNGAQKWSTVFYARPILSGKHKGKFAADEILLQYFEIDNYEIGEVSPQDFEEETEDE
jgi:hypothetical protein